MNFLKTLSAVVLLAGAISLSGCKGASKKSDSGIGSSVSESDIHSDLADSDSGKAGGLETVYFDFDSSTLTGEAKTTLEKNAGILQSNPSFKIQIEGHTDERGGIQYNIALGERRADSTRKFLQDHGVGSERVTTISYGKERPVDSGHDESAWSKNRRANFRITSK